MPPEWIYVTKNRMQVLSRIFPGTYFETVHIFRLYTFAFHQHFPYATKPSLVQLDLDDIESQCRRRLGKLYRRNGHKIAAEALSREADLYEHLERQLLSTPDRVFVCSEQDRSFILRHYECRNIELLPNVVQTPPNIHMERAHPGPFSFLFLGALHYYPNEEGIRYFCREVLPRIKQDIKRDFVVRIAGRGSSKRLRRYLASLHQVDFLGEVPDVKPCYADSDAVIVPIRAGGGTRIKVLEAFAHKRPVVSTHLGAEGIMAEHDKHLLLASDTEGFVRHCVRLMKNPELRRRLTTGAFELVCQTYNPNIMKKTLTKN
jgi:glycosyltransferase involved in cell wall biosynthesis